MLRKSSLNWLVVCTLAICPLLIYGRASAQDESLKPGINDGYEKQPVESSVKRFENDKRAVVMKQAEILKACRLKPGMIVADVGSGTGLFTRPIAAGVAPDGKVYAVDVTEQFVQHVKATSAVPGVLEEWGDL